MKQCIILDRDGVINQDSDHYIKSPDEWIPIPGSLEAIAHLNRRGYWVAVATNQSGIGRGYFSLATLQAMHEKMNNQLARVGGHVDCIVYCPHHPDEDCPCRKPKIGLLTQIEEQLHINLKTAFFVGDTYKDLQASKLAGCQGVLVRTGKGQKTLAEHPELLTSYPIYNNLQEFAETL